MVYKSGASRLRILSSTQSASLQVEFSQKTCMRLFRGESLKLNGRAGTSRNTLWYFNQSRPGSILITNREGKELFRGCFNQPRVEITHDPAPEKPLRDASHQFYKRIATWYVAFTDESTDDGVTSSEFVIETLTTKRPKSELVTVRRLYRWNDVRAFIHRNRSLIHQMKQHH